MIPVINVIFLLLIYFLMQGSAKQIDAIPVNAPVSINGKSIVADPAILLLTKDTLMLDGKKIPETQLRQKLEELAAKSPEKQVMVKADAKLDSTKFISVLKIIKQSGVASAYMVTTSP